MQAPPLEPRYAVVLESRLAHSDYEKAAERLCAAHHALRIDWDGDWRKLEAQLLAARPAELALVLDPGSIDANLPRRLVPILARFDDDPFVDCSFGLITGASGADALALVERDLALQGRELAATKLEAVSVVLDECLRLAPRPERGPEGRELASQSLWVTGKDAHWREFLAQWRGEQHGAGLVEWGHCGDPQGIWLFSMYRNREREKHWPFDPAKVGQDPAGELPRLTPAALLEGVDLGGALVLNGSCHSAVTRRAIVGPDIVSTFGDTQGKFVFFDIRPEESFPLQAIAHGASAYIGPLAANNANRAALEEWTLRAGGVSAGECLRRTYDELVMGAAKLPLRFALFEDGRAEPEEPPMFQSSFHRVLFGDPALLPWKDALPTSHEIVAKELEDGLELALRWKDAGRDPWIWDPWREESRGAERGRMYARIELARERRGEPRIEALEGWTLLGGERSALALEPLARLERDPAGKCVLHLVLRGDRARMSPADRKGMPDELGATLRVRFSASAPAR